MVRSPFFSATRHIQFPCLHASVHDRVRAIYTIYTYTYVYMYTWLMYKYLITIHMRLSTIIRIRPAKHTRGEVAINLHKSGRSHAYVHARASEMRAETTRARARSRSPSNVQTLSRWALVYTRVREKGMIVTSYGEIGGWMSSCVHSCALHCVSEAWGDSPQVIRWCVYRTSVGRRHNVMD